MHGEHQIFHRRIFQSNHSDPPVEFLLLEYKDQEFPIKVKVRWDKSDSKSCCNFNLANHNFVINDLP